MWCSFSSGRSWLETTTGCVRLAMTSNQPPESCQSAPSPTPSSSTSRGETPPSLKFFLSLLPATVSPSRSSLLSLPLHLLYATSSYSLAISPALFPSLLSRSLLIPHLSSFLSLPHLNFAIHPPSLPPSLSLSTGSCIMVLLAVKWMLLSPFHSSWTHVLYHMIVT